jgi:hydroxyacylglutathione hydrolase
MRFLRTSFLASTFLNRRTSHLHHHLYHHRMMMSSSTTTIQLLGREPNDICSIYCVPMFSDNYGYIIVDKATNSSAIVDPGEPEPVWSKCQELGLNKPDMLLVTHKHNDHCGGNLYFKDMVPSIEIVGTRHESSPIPGVTRPVGEGDEFTLGSLRIQVMHVPCHTTGHVAFVVSSSSTATASEQESQSLLFCGDTLFIGGCGKFFEGSPDQMLSNLRRFMALPASTKVFCAHEYTLSNLKFLNSIDPERIEATGILKEASAKRDRGVPTVPSTIGEERRYNLFCLCDDESVQRLVGATDAVDCMRLLREMKNKF